MDDLPILEGMTTAMRSTERAERAERAAEVLHKAEPLEVIKGGRVVYCGACACGWVSDQFRDAVIDAEADAKDHQQQAHELARQRGE